VSDLVCVTDLPAMRVRREALAAEYRELDLAIGLAEGRLCPICHLERGTHAYACEGHDNEH
jgi:hypothetical protein